MSTMEHRQSGSGSSNRALPSPPSTISLTLLTWDIKSCHLQEASRRGMSGRRNFLIPHVHNHLIEQGLTPQLVLFQEAASSSDVPSVGTLWKESKHYRKCLQQCEEGTEPVIEALTMDSLANQVGSLVPERNKKDNFGEKDKKEWFASYLCVEDHSEREMMRAQLLPRVCTRKLRITQDENKATIIAASFYNISKRSAEEKKKCIRLFFNLMCRLAHVHQCLVLVGGSFNLHLEEWREDVEGRFPNRVHVAGRYSPTPRHSQSITDTFAVVYPPRSRDSQRVKCWFSPPIPIYPFPESKHTSICNRMDGAVPRDFRDDGKRFEMVYFGEDDFDTLQALLPETLKGTPDWGVLQDDFGHDPVYVTATLQFLSG